MTTTDAELLALYQDSVDKRRLDLLACWEQLRDGSGDAETIRRVWKNLHQLSGSAGAYGYAGLGDASKLLEKACLNWLESQQSSDETPERFGRRCQGDFDELEYQLERCLQAA